MKKSVLIIGILVLGLTILAQEIQHETIAINIEVPVRVFTKGKFVEELTIKDFEVYEDGILQEIEAVYLVKKTKIEREDIEIKKKKVRKTFSPQLSRQFVLIFEIRDFLPKVEEAIQYFFEEVIIPGDKLIVTTPTKSYNFKEDSWRVLSRKNMAKKLIEKLRRDAKIRPLDWTDLASYTEGAEGVITGTVEAYMGRKYIDEKRLIDTAEYLKKLPGQKNVFLFLQQELSDSPIMPLEVSSVAGIWASLDYLSYMSMVASYNYVDPKKIKKAFSDSSILFNFIYLKDESYWKNLDTFDTSNRMFSTILDSFDTTNGMFSIFKELSNVTGGITQTTANADASFRNAVYASENYYLLFYSPKNYRADGKFKMITVRVKGKNYRVTHRAGYIAD